MKSGRPDPRNKTGGLGPCASPVSSPMRPTTAEHKSSGNDSAAYEKQSANSPAA